MEDVAHDGRTVLFVSHNETAVRRLCKRAILLRSGQVDVIGTPQEAFAKYRVKQHDTSFNSENRTVRSKQVKICDAHLSVNAVKTSEIINGMKPEINLLIEARESVDFYPEVLIRNADSVPIMMASVGNSTGKVYRTSVGRHSICFELDLPYLAAGRYSVDLILAAANSPYRDYIEEAMTFAVSSSNFEQVAYPYEQSQNRGCVFVASRPLDAGLAPSHAYWRDL
jgi:lipopolysaccharide transport system ATP-binding protein